MLLFFFWLYLQLFVTKVCGFIAETTMTTMATSEDSMKLYHTGAHYHMFSEMVVIIINNPSKVIADMGVITQNPKNQV